MNPAMTDFRAYGTIMGPAGLTAVFGMGTGVAPPVWSPGKRPGGVSQPTGRMISADAAITSLVESRRQWASSPGRGVASRMMGDARTHAGPPSVAAAGRGGQAARLLGPVGCDGRPSCTPG